MNLDIKIKEIYEYFNQDLSCKTYYIGSLATNLYDSYSDIDLMVISKVPLILSQRKVPFLNYEFSHKKTDFYIEPSFDITHFTEEDVKNFNNFDLINYIYYSRPVRSTSPLIELKRSDLDISKFVLSNDAIIKKCTSIRKTLPKLQVCEKRDDLEYKNYLLNYCTESFLNILLSKKNIPYIYPKKAKRQLFNAGYPKEIIDYFSKTVNLSLTETPVETLIFQLNSFLEVLENV